VKAAVKLTTFNFSKKCQKDLSAVGTGAEAVQQGAGAAVFLNGVGSDVTMASLYATSPNPGVVQAGNSQTGTVGSDFAGHPGDVAIAQLGGPDIYLNPTNINPSDYWTNLAIVLHEVLHNVTGLTDYDLQSKLGLPQSKISDNITQKLLQDCF
jgi:hypothetical protein